MPTARRHPGRWASNVARVMGVLVADAAARRGELLLGDGGLGITPRRGAVIRTFVDAITNANYMFLRSPPPEWTLLRLLGPWPWYIASAAGVALVLLALLDLPFWLLRRRAQGQAAVQAER